MVAKAITKMATTPSSTVAVPAKSGFNISVCQILLDNKSCCKQFQEKCSAIGRIKFRVLRKARPSKSPAKKVEITVKNDGEGPNKCATPKKALEITSATTLLK